VKCILFIKLGAIGDVIQAAAAIEEYRRLNPEVRVDWMVGKAIASLLKEIAVVDQIIAVPDQGLFSKSLVMRVVALIKIYMEIIPRMRRYEAIYIAHTAWQYSLLAMPAYLRNPGLLLTKLRRFYPKLNEYRVSEYSVFLSRQSISSSNGALLLQSLGKRLLENNKDLANELEVDRSKKWVALIPGGGKNMVRDDSLRRWPIENYVQLASELMAQGYGVILLGGNTDQWVKPFFNGMAVKDLIGNTSLVETVIVMSLANLVISHDTGPFHLATLTSTPLIGIFGPTPVSAVAPIGRKQFIIFKAPESVKCAPCYDGFGYAPCDNPICMQASSVLLVLNAVNNLLNGGMVGAQ